MKTNTLEGLRRIDLHIIIALPRTGSTLLATMLGNHEHVLTSIEEPFFFTLYEKYGLIRKWKSSAIRSYVEDLFLFALHKSPAQMPKKEDLVCRLMEYKAYLDWSLVVRLTFLSFQQVSLKKELKVIITKELSLHNHLDKLAEFFPQSKFIFLYRNPLDNISRWRDYRKNYLNKKDTIDSLAIRWNYRYGKIISAKSRLNTDRYMEVKYCDLVTDPELELERICKFLNLEFDSNMLNYADSAKNSVKILPNFDKSQRDTFKKFHSGVLQQPNNEKIGIWKRELSDQDAARILSYTSLTASEIGYETPKDLTVQLSILDRIKKFFFLTKKKLIIGFWDFLPFFGKRKLKQIKYQKLIKKLYE